MLSLNPYSTQLIEEDDIEAVAQVLRGATLTQGEQTEIFEKELAEYLGVKYVLTFNSATSALYCAYKAYNLADSEVITTPISFVATCNMLLENDAKPIFCDIKSDGNINEEKIASLITPKTKAIVSVDYAGKSVEIEKIKAIAQEHNLIWISDSSHSFGGEYKGEKIGGFADSTIFSFHPLKPLTTGEGVELATNDENIYKRAKLIRSHGVVKKTLWNSEVSESGFNFRMTDIASALGRSQLKKVDSFIARREQIARFYDEIFDNNPHFDTLLIPSYIKSSRHLYPIFLKQKYFCSKEEIFKALQKEGLGVQVHYKPIHLYSLYSPYSPLYMAEAFYKAEISIPCHQKMTQEDAKITAEKIFSVFQSLQICKA